jgi:hypothetical protein
MPYVGSAPGQGGGGHCLNGHVGKEADLIITNAIWFLLTIAKLGYNEIRILSKWEQNKSELDEDDTQRI